MYRFKSITYSAGADIEIDLVGGCVSVRFCKTNGSPNYLATGVRSSGYAAAPVGRMRRTRSHADDHVSGLGRSERPGRSVDQFVLLIEM